MLEKLQSRKFWFCAYVLALAPVLLWFGKLDPTTFAGLVTLVSGVYVAGRSYVTGCQIKVGQPGSQPNPPPE